MEVKFPPEFNGLNPDAKSESSELLLRPRSLLFEKFKLVLTEVTAPGEDLTPALGELEELLAPGGKAVKLCCVTYKIFWVPAGFAANDIVTLKKFSAGDDSWGPFNGYQIPQQGNPVVQNEEVQICKEDAHCEELAVGKLEFEWDPLESTCRHASLSIL